MKFDVLINQLDNHNEVAIILAKKFNVKTIVLLCESNKERDVQKFRELFFKLDNIEVIIESIQYDSYDNLKNIIIKYKERKSIINLNGGDRLTSFLILKISLELKMNSLYVDLLRKKRYILSEEYRVIEEGLEDISINDVIELSGSSIIQESTDITNREDIQNFTRIILRNINLWHKYKQKLYDNNIFNHDYKDNYRVNINKNFLVKEELILINKILHRLKDDKEINFEENKFKIMVEFKNNYLKSFIFKSGTWLEILTTLAINEINEIDEVKTSVIFYWGDELKRVKNELDVVAIKDSILICVSCKDSDKYDEDALNELQVYSNRLGGKNTIKILVATKEPVKKAVLDRAKEMDINLVTVDGDYDKFKRELVKIIKKKTV